MDAYCVKCKKKRAIENAEPTVLKNGRAAMTGTCSVCGTKVVKFGGGSSSGGKLGEYCKPA
jgi:hypothetical protein